MLKKPKILVLGSFMMDLIASTKRAPNAGETVTGLKFTTAPGGKGANQAVQCARLGADVTMVGRVGNDAFGEIMLATASQAGVDISHVERDPVESSGIGHILLEVTDNGAQNRITICPGANYNIKTDDLSWLKANIGQFDMLMMQFELPMEVIETAAEWAYNAGVSVMINPAPAAPLSRSLLKCATYISPNEHEAASLSQHPLRVSENGVNMNDLQEIADSFHSFGVKNLIVTLGENGSIIADKHGISITPCVKMKHVADPTAAGDSFVAAFCTGICAGLKAADALAFASHTAAITVSRMGAMPSLPTLDEVRDLMTERGYKGFDLSLLDALK